MLRCVAPTLAGRSVTRPRTRAPLRPGLPMGLAAVGLAVVLPAVAQFSRPFPATALRGELVVTQPPEITLSDQPARLAPGARIRGQDNLLQMSAALVGRKFAVHYTLDPYGLVRDVWILTPAEAARTPWPATPQQAQRWSFDAAAQSWTPR